MEQTTKLFLFIDGDKIGRVQDISAKTESGKVHVMDIEKGLAGFHVGAGKVTVSGTCYIPIGGMEQFNFWNAASQNGEVHEVEVAIGAERYISEGIFDDAEITGSVDKETQVKFTFTGKPKDLE